MKLYTTRKEILSLDWQKNPRPLRDRAGVYRIVDKKTKELLYIGQSNDLGNRLAPAKHPVMNRKLHDVYILFENDKQTRSWMECQFIHVLKPSRNIRNGMMPKPSGEELDAYYHLIMDACL